MSTNPMLDAAAELGRFRAKRMAAHIRMSAQDASRCLELHTSNEESAAAHWWDLYSPPDEPALGEGPIKVLLDLVDSATQCAVLSAYETGLMYAWIEKLVDHARDTVADALNDTSRCPAAISCATCGGVDALQRIIVDLVPYGFACLALCSACKGSEKLPRLSHPEAARMVLEHCAHAGVALDIMAGIARGEREQLARAAGLEPATAGFGGQSSTCLSYAHLPRKPHEDR